MMHILESLQLMIDYMISLKKISNSGKMRGFLYEELVNRIIKLHLAVMIVFGEHFGKDSMDIFYQIFKFIKKIKTKIEPTTDIYIKLFDKVGDLTIIYTDLATVEINIDDLLMIRDSFKKAIKIK